MEYDEKVKLLKKYRGLVREIELRDLEIATFDDVELTRATNISVGELDKIVVSGGNAVNAIENYSEKELRLAKLLLWRKRSFELAEKILNAIMAIENVYFRNAVYCAYVLGMTDEEIAFSEKIVKSAARYRRRQGILCLDL